MKGIGRFAFSTCAAALFAGCGALRQAQGDMPPIGAPATNAGTEIGAMHQSLATSSYHVLHRFSLKGRAASATPIASLLEMQGTLYGTAIAGGGTGCHGNGCGTVFAITP